MRCTACTICEKECPPQCIYIVKDTDKKPDYVGKMQFQPKVFDIDISVCMGCGICVEVCPFDSIKMDQVFELSTGDRFGDLLLHKTQSGQAQRILSSTSIQTEAAEVDAARAEEKRKAEAAAAAKAAAPRTAPSRPAPGRKMNALDQIFVIDCNTGWRAWLRPLCSRWFRRS